MSFMHIPALPSPKITGSGAPGVTKLTRDVAGHALYSTPSKFQIVVAVVRPAARVSKDGDAVVFAEIKGIAQRALQGRLALQRVLRNRSHRVVNFHADQCPCESVGKAGMAAARVGPVRAQGRGYQPGSGRCSPANQSAVVWSVRSESPSRCTAPAHSAPSRH